MSTRLQMRYDTAANWTAANPVLAQGEQGKETDTGRIKNGDGTTAWNSLFLPFDTSQLASDHTNATITPTKVTGMDKATGVGTFMFNYYVLYSSSVATTGVIFDVNYSGTVTKFVWQQRWVDALATASSAAADQDAILSTGSAVGAFASRGKGTAGRGATVSVDTASADMLMVIEGLMIVTAAGNIELWHGSETANTTTVKIGSSLQLTQTA